MADPLPPARERGAALLTVLLLVVVMSVVTATLLERLTIATRLTGNAGALDQVRAYTLSDEALAAARIGDLIDGDPHKTTLAGGSDGGLVGKEFGCTCGSRAEELH